MVCGGMRKGWAVCEVRGAGHILLVLFSENAPWPSEVSEKSGPGVKSELLGAGHDPGLAD